MRHTGEDLPKGLRSTVYRETSDGDLSWVMSVAGPKPETAGVKRRRADRTGRGRFPPQSKVSPRSMPRTALPLV